MEKYLKDNHGGTVIYGGKNIKKESRFFEPTVIESPSKTSLLMQDEIFGPILPVFYYTDLKDTIREIVARPKPLVVYLFSESATNAKLVREGTSSGAFVVNETILQMSNLNLPFGGVGGSGYGRYHGKDGFLAFSNPRSIAKVSSADNFPSNQKYPPFTEGKKSLMKKMLGFGFVTYSQLGKFFAVLALIVVCAVLAKNYLPACLEPKQDL